MTVFKSLLDVVRSCDKFPYEIDINSTEDVHHATPITLGPHTIGNVLPKVFAALNEYNESFTEKKPFVITKKYITFADWVNTPELRTETVRALMDTWREEKAFRVLAGWRNELYPVYGDDSQTDNIAFAMERAATALFGVSTFGAHVNGYVQKHREIHMWVAKRSKTKPTYPGLWDNTVAGGISYGDGIKHTVIKECEEEAKIPAELASKAKYVNTVIYYTYTDGGLQPETEYVYDLEFASDFEPSPRDGEVERFELWPLSKVKETILNNEWKLNSGVVAIDFMMRHGFIQPDEEPDFIDIIYHLHRKLPFPSPRRGLNK